MKKALLILCLVTVLCFTGCTANSDAPGNDLDLWAGVSGDTLELSITGRDMTAVLNKDGTASLSSLYNEYIPAADFSERLKDYDAEMGAVSRYYGTFKVEGENIVLTFDDQTFYCLVVRGKDAEAFKEAYIALHKEETSAEIESIKAAFGKGFSTSESDGIQTLTCSFDGKTLRILTLQYHTKAGVLVSELVMREDGSYTNTLYYEDGTIQEVQEYTADDTCTKTTRYHSDGSVEYVEQTVRTDENNSTTTRTDADGNVIYLHERITEDYDGGKRVIQRRTENGVITYCDILDEKDNGLIVSTFDEISGDNVIHKVSVTGGINDNEYSVYKVTCNGTLTEYQCHRYFADGDVYY